MKIDRYESALRFYADRNTYKHPCDPSCCDGLEPAIAADLGAKARAALGLPETTDDDSQDKS